VHGLPSAAEVSDCGRAAIESKQRITTAAARISKSPGE
jgi:hypothetical protein